MNNSPYAQRQTAFVSAHPPQYLRLNPLSPQFRWSESHSTRNAIPPKLREISILSRILHPNEDEIIPKESGTRGRVLLH